MTRHIVALLIALAVHQTTAARADDGPARDVPELQALANYAGTWDVVITSKDFPFAKGEATGKWILDGRFLQQSGLVSSADGETTLRITTLMTYDQEQKSYRMWSFLSNGKTSESTGKWDPQNRTMTSTRREGSTTTTTTAKFTTEGIEEWSIVTRDQSNDIVGEFAGKNTRRKQ